MNYFHRLLVLTLHGSILSILAASLLHIGYKHLNSCDKSLQKAGFQKVGMNYTGIGNESIITIQYSQKPSHHWDFKY